MQARNFIVDLPHTLAGTVRATGSPVRLSDTPVRLDHAGPLLGEHTRDVLTRLGIPGSEIDELARSGVLGRLPG